MFKQLRPVAPKRQVATLSASLVVHFLFLAWILHSPAPIFVAPASVVRGQEGSYLTRIYFGGDRGVSQERPKQLKWQRPPKVAKAHSLEPPLAKMELGNEVASNRPSGPAAGSLYGSLSYGTVTGPEIRPALPVVSPDPVFGSDAASVDGDVVVEITIDETG